MARGTPAVVLDAVSLAHRNGTRALRSVSLQLAPGEQVAVIGPSGAGKTTLLRVLSATLAPQSGAVTLLGQSPWRLSPRARQRLRARLGLVHQAPPLPPVQRVITAVSAGRLGRWSAGRALLNLAWPLDAAGISGVLRRLDLEDRLYSRCDSLSGGQLQRVGIARALYQQADLLLADEPVSAMDPRLAAHCLQILQADAASRGAPLVVSLHAVDLALEAFPRIIGLREGQILFDKPAAEVSPAELSELFDNAQLSAPEATRAAEPPGVIPRC